MTGSWDDMRKAKENEYFERKNKQALERLAERKKEEKPRLSPITGEPMEHVNLHGVIIDRCPTTGGIWLDKGELEELIEAEKEHTESESGGIATFFKTLTGSAK